MRLLEEFWYGNEVTGVNLQERRKAQSYHDG